MFVPEAFFLPTVEIDSLSMETPLCIIWDCDGTLIDTEKGSSDIIASIMESVKPGSRDIE